jgi:TPR repeat protein
VTDKLISFKSLFSSSIDYHYSGSFNGLFDVLKKKVYRMGEVSIEFLQLNSRDVSSIFFLINEFLVDRHKWHEKMAEAGNVQSQVFLSSSSHSKPDVEEYWLTKAAENGHISAQHNLGIRFLSKDKRRAFYWLSLAAKQGNENSKQRLKSDFS